MINLTFKPPFYFYSYKCFLFILWFSPFFSCSKPPPLKLTSTQRSEVDTLYLRIVTPLSKQLDSTCETNRLKQIKYLIDSMRDIRLSEEGKLRLKYLKNEK